MVTFPTNISSIVKKMQIIMYLICKQFAKTMFMLLIVLSFSNFQKCFFLLDYTDFAHRIAHTKFSK